MRELVVGDIHGHSKALESLLAVVCPTKNDRITFLGDYIDRGPSSRRVLDLLLELSDTTSSRFLRGNHESYLLASMDAPEIEQTWLGCGGDSTLKSFDVSCAADIPLKYRQFLEQHPLWIEDEKFIFVHAGLNAHKPMCEQSEDDLLWTHPPFAPWHSSRKRVVCGHSFVPTPVFNTQSCQLDTGIARGGWLTCLDLNDHSYVQANFEGVIRKLGPAL